MKISESEFKRIATAIFYGLDRIIKKLRDDLYREIASQVANSRRQLWSGKEWCCPDMKHFAKKYFNITSPQTENSGWAFSNHLTITGRTLNYCPFCGTPANRAYRVEKDG